MSSTAEAEVDSTTPAAPEGSDTPGSPTPADAQEVAASAAAPETDAPADGTEDPVADEPVADEPVADADGPAAAATAPSSTPGMVYLTQLGFPRSVPGSLMLRCDGVPESARQRLVSAGAELTDDPEQAVEALVVSTRLPPEAIRRVSEHLAARVGRTIVLAHTGAERLAAQLVRAGADAVVGEGNEEALIGLIDHERTPTGLLASFERRFGGNANGRNGQGRDATTGLHDRRSFERRLGSLGDAEEVPRVAFVKVVSDRWNTSNPDAVVSVQRRRLATTLEHIATNEDSELYSTGVGEFGLISTQLSPHDATRVGNRLVEATATYRDRGLPLRAVVGHAGSESAHDPEELLDLARRAVEVAAVDGTRRVLSAEDLALGVSVTTELEALVRLLDEVEPALPEGRGHGERVGRMAAHLARIRGASPGVVSRIQLAGHLHDIGRAGLPPATIGGPEGLSGELLEAWRTFPTRSAELLQLTAGPAVARAVRGQRERWDGNGFPEGLPGEEIPESSRIIAVVHAIDEEIAAAKHLGAHGVEARLRERRGTELDPDLVEAAILHLEQLLAERG